MKNLKKPLKSGLLTVIGLALLLSAGCAPKTPGEEPVESAEGLSTEPVYDDDNDLDALSEMYRIVEDETGSFDDPSVESETAETAAPSAAPSQTSAPRPTAPPAPTAPPTVWTCTVNKTLNYVVVYRNGAPVKGFICSVGESTPTGVFHTTDKYTWRALFGNSWGQYATRIVNNILFHSVPYESARPDTLETAEYNKLGTTASAGCVRMTVAGCKWIFDNCPKGMEVTITEEVTPCPVGIAGAVKIPADCTWDPTDPNVRNPWAGYTGEAASAGSEGETHPEESTPESTEPPVSSEPPASPEAPSESASEHSSEASSDPPTEE